MTFCRPWGQCGSVSSRFHLMPSSEVIDSYITRVVSAESRDEDPLREATSQSTEVDEREARLQKELKEALDRDDKKKAIRAAWALMQDDEENEDIQMLHSFLLSRVGVALREPLFSFSTQPVVQWLSGLAVAAPALFLAAHLLSPAESETDAISCLGAILFFGIPLWDLLFANCYNYLNRDRLRC